MQSGSNMKQILQDEIKFSEYAPDARVKYKLQIINYLYTSYLNIFLPLCVSLIFVIHIVVKASLDNSGRQPAILCSTLLITRVRKTSRSHGRWPEEGPRKTIGTSMPHPSYAYFLLFCEEGLPSTVFLTAGRLAIFLNSAYYI